MGLNKPSRKEACPKTSRYQPAFRPMFAFRPAPMPTRRPCLPGVHAHLTPMLNRRSVSTGTHTHLASVFRSAPIFARWSYFDRCPVSTDTMPTRCSYFARRPCLPGIRISTVAPFRPVPMSTWRPCPSDIPVLSSAHAHLVLMPHPILKGDRSGTYRPRTSGTNPPWQESYSMHDFEAPDVK